MTRRLLPWLAILALTGAMTALTTAQSLAIYDELRSGWSWDLAWNNQWFWSILHADGMQSVRPINIWANEGPPVWVHTHFDPIRLPILPIYALFPHPKTLIVVQNVVFWWAIPAAFTLVRSETRSTRLALLAAALVPMTPQFWPLVWNDYREMQLGIPFVLWAIEGFRHRRVGLTSFAIVALLCCREEYAVLIGTLALLPPAEPEPIGRTYRWSRAVFVLGVGWMLFAFLGYESIFVSRSVPKVYIGHFHGAPIGPILQAQSALDLLVYGFGSWFVLALFAPRMALLALPWVVALVRGRWAESMLATWTWSLVRYTSPATGAILAAGVVGFGRLGERLRARWGPWALAGLWVASAAGLLAARGEIVGRLDRIPQPISRDEAAEIWRWIGQVGPDDAVLAAYEVTAPLSSRRHLYSNVMDLNKPPGYPRLGPEFRWAFLRKDDLPPETLTDQGFEVVHRGDFVWIYRRAPGR